MKHINPYKIGYTRPNIEQDKNKMKDTAIKLGYTYTNSEEYHMDNFNRSIDEFEVGDTVICIHPYQTYGDDDMLKIDKFEEVEVVEVEEGEKLDYGYILIKNKNGKTEQYHMNRLMPGLEYNAIKFKI